MKMIRIALFMFTIFSFLYGCTGKDTSEEKIRITIEHQSNRSAPEPAKPEPQPPTTQPQVEKAKKSALQPKEQESPDVPEKKALSGLLSFKTVADNLNVDQHSKNEIGEFWLSVRGKTVIWGGKYKSDKN
jgi:hypothetical protein